MTAEKRLVPGECKVSGCEHKIFSAKYGYCSGHYQRMMRGISGAEFAKPIRPRSPKGTRARELVSKAKDIVKGPAVQYREPVTVMMKPMPDQQVAIDKLRKVKSRICGDSMGVGKTVTGIGLDFAMREDNRGNDSIAEGPCLIICEKIGIDVWDYHLRAMGVPEDEILLIDPTDRQWFVDELNNLASFQSIRGSVKKRPKYRYYVCHWDVLTRVDELNEKTPSGKPKIHWAHVIGDEIHLAKNRKALRTIELKRISAEYKTGLSGTPADDKPQDFWSPLHWILPKMFRAYWRFYEHYIEYETSPMGYRIQTGTKNIKELHRLIRPYYIRRTLLEVAPNMPPKIHVEPPITVQLGKNQRREYERMRDKAIALLGASDESELGTGQFTLLAPAVIAVLTRLQQMALATLTPEWDVDWGDEDSYETGAEDDEDWDMPNIVLSKPSPKLEACMNLITTHEEEPFVVFTQFRGMADLVEEECQRLKIPVVKIHGAITDKNERTRLVKKFQDGDARVFVGTIAAAGKTITLTRAAHVIFTDLSWNPSKNEQAEDRLWRRTQDRTVFVHRIEAEDTIDQIRYARIMQKGDWVSKLMDPKGIGRTKTKVAK